MMQDREMGVGHGEIIDGKYRVLRALGRGGMGSVVVAEHIELGDQVAIKILAPGMLARPEIHARFLREAQTARQITSKHAVKVFDFGRLPAGSPYFVMELLEGEDLADVVATRGPLPAREAAGYIKDACEAVAEAHRKGIVHRDLKPANLFLSRGPHGQRTVKVLDFGIAKVRDDAQHIGDQLTTTGSVFGTPSYMSPEQIRASHMVDPRSDVWSLGVVLYYLVTGSYPYGGDNLIAIAFSILREPPTPLSARSPGVPAALDAIVMRCLAKDPDARFQSATDLLRALESFTLAEAANAEANAPIGPAAESESRAPGLDNTQPLGTTSDALFEARLPRAMDTLGLARSEDELTTRRIPLVAEGAPALPAGRSSPAPCPLPTNRLSRRPRPPLRRLAQQPLVLLGVAGALSAAALFVRRETAATDSTPAWVVTCALALGGAVCLLVGFARWRERRSEARPSPETPLLVSTAALTLSPPFAPVASPVITLSPELQSYLARARVRISGVSGRVHFLAPEPGSAVPSARLAAISFDDVIAPGEKTLSTEAFHVNIPELLSFIGTVDQPWHVLAVFRAQPAAGVYRMWNALESRKVRILPISPHLIRAALDSDPEAHLSSMIRSAPLDPFDLPGSVPDELGELEFFGARSTLQNMLADLERRCPGLGAFGFSRWGVTSLLRRLRLELSDYVTVWVDMRALPDVSAATLLGTVHDKLRAALGHPPSDLLRITGPESESALHRLLTARAPGDRRALLLFLDHIDCLGVSGQDDNPDLLWIARCLYGLLAREEPHPAFHIVFGGQDDSLLTKRFFRIGGAEVKNPLWKCGRSHPVPFFSVDELADFFARLGGMAGLALSRAAVEEAHRLTGGHKYLSRRLGSLLFRERREGRLLGATVDAADVARCGGVLRATESEYFEAVIEHLPKGAQLCLQALAERSKGRHRKGGFAASLDADAEFLCGYSLVTRGPGTDGYAPTVGVLSEWLLSRAPRPAISGDGHLPPPEPDPGGPRSMVVPGIGAGDGRTQLGDGKPTSIRPHGTTYSTHYIVPPTQGFPVERRALPARADVFIACAPGDEPMGRELERCLRHPLEQAGVAIGARWHLKPGANTSDVEATISAAKLFVVLLSGDFFDDAHCKDVLLPRLKRRVALQDAYLVPVVLKYCSWSSDPFFGRLLPLPQKRDPVCEWPSRDAAWQDVVEGLLPIVKERCRLRAPQEAQILQT